MKVSGKVTHVERDIVGFTLSVWSSIPTGAANTHLDIRAIISRKTNWPFPSLCLPCPNSLVSFCGNLITVENEVAVVALDDMTFLPHPGTLRGIPPPPILPPTNIDYIE